MFMECQCEGWLTAKMKSIIGFLEDEYPSCSKTPEPYAKAYRTGALNLETIDSKSVRVESATGRS